jgi:hypothetical protein
LDLTHVDGVVVVGGDEVGVGRHHRGEGGVGAGVLELELNKWLNQMESE